MSYHQFNRKEVLQKPKENCSKRKSCWYYLKNKEAIKEKSKNRCKKLSKEEKDRIKELQKNRHQQLIQHKESIKKQINFVLPIIKMSEKTLKFDNTEINKKEFHKSKQPINLNLVTVDQIVISDKFKHSDDGFQYFIVYKKDDIVKPLCIILKRRKKHVIRN